jgi:phage terminase small subunit
MALSSRHRKVIDNYLIHADKRKALRDNGYSETTVVGNPNAIFNLPSVKNELERRVKRMTDKAELTDDWIINRLMDIADANIGDMIEVDTQGLPSYNFNKLTPAIRRAISSVDVNVETAGRGPNAKPVYKIKVKPADKLRAIEMLMKYKGMLTEKAEVKIDNSLSDRINEAMYIVSDNESKV